jgi:hypothetical protein
MKSSMTARLLWIFIFHCLLTVSDSGLRKTLSKFELWGACEELNFPYLPTRRLYDLARWTGRREDTGQFTQVRATLLCNTLLLLCGGLPQGGLWMN